MAMEKHNQLESRALNMSKRISWFLYMIECDNGSIYTGIAVDVASRYLAHVCGKGAKYTRAHKPRALLLAVRYPDRSTASRAEYQFKQLTAQHKRMWIAKGIALADEEQRQSGF
jgi:putative endonuclease